jgi:hypothetical protein
MPDVVDFFKRTESSTRPRDPSSLRRHRLRFGQRTGCFIGSNSKRLPEGPDRADQSRIAQRVPIRLVGIRKRGAGVHFDENPGAASAAAVEGIGFGSSRSSRGLIHSLLSGKGFDLFPGKTVKSLKTR